MISIVKKVLNDFIFKQIMIVLMTIMLMPYIQHNYGGYIKYFLLFGIAICFFYVVKEKFFFIEDKVFILISIFSASYFVSIFLNRDSCFLSNLKEFVYMVVFFFLFFICVGKNAVSAEKEFKIVSWTLFVVTFIASMFNFCTFLFGIEDWYYFDEGDSTLTRIWYYVGYYNGRLNGLFNANATATISLISIIVTLFFIVITLRSKESSLIRRTFLFVGLFVNMFIQYSCLLLSNTRGALYTALIIACIFIFILMMKKSNAIRAKKLFRSLAITLVVGVTLFVFSTSFLKSLAYLPSVFQSIVSAENMPSINLSITDKNLTQINLLNISPVDVKRVDSSEVSSGRLDIWHAAFSLFKEAPLFGFTREGFVDPVYQIVYDQTGVYNSAVITGGLHNIYLTVLLSSGLIGFILLGIIVVIVIYKALYSLIKSKDIDVFLLFSLMVSLSFLILEFVESRILYQANIFNVIFWIYFGYLYYFANCSEQKLKKEMVE